MYQSKLNIKETEKAIKIIKTIFEEKLINNLNLSRISAPMFVKEKTGINDDLNGVEKPVSFKYKDEEIQIVHSLAKWKRMALYDYDFKLGEGIYTDMNAIRKDEELDPIHSIYVDQWDWEKIINKENRNLDYLKETVKLIYQCVKETEKEINKIYPVLENKLPEDIFFITTDELLELYPNISSKERENEISRKYKAVFLIGIGDELKNNQPHDGRSPDYDDWHLNGDILLFNEALDSAFEISSMGIRVDKESLIHQLTKKGKLERLKFSYHQMIISETLPFTIGGGIGQSRLSMYLLEKKHIGEVQASYWPDEMIEECKKNNIILL